MRLKPLFKWLTIGILSFAAIAIFAVISTFIVRDVHKRLTWPQIALDFDGWSQHEGDVAFTKNYVGTDLEVLRNELEEFGYICKQSEMMVSCKFLTDTLMDSIYWIVEIGFQQQGKITNLRGTIHSVM